MQKQTIFYLEGRGGCFIYHFFIYNLGGLYHIVNEEYNERRKSDSVLLQNYRNKIVNRPTTELTFPIKIHMTNILPFQRQAFDIIKSKFELVEDLSTINYDYEIVSMYGAFIDYKNNVQNDIYSFLRNLFLENLKEINNAPNKKRIFITRKNSESLHGFLKRSVINENELVVMLKKYNFEFIQLEDFDVYEKIKLFMQSEIILSPHGSALTFLLFANNKCKIIELLKNGTNGFAHNQIVDLCKGLYLNYNRYSNINEDVNGNFTINVEEFEKYLVQLL